MMPRFWKKLAAWLYTQGERHANLKSVRGSYEGPVPQKIQKSNCKTLS